MKMNYQSGILVGVFTMTWVYLTLADDDTPAELNTFCRRREDCPDYGYWCSGNMTCQCLDLYIPNNARTRCVGGVGRKCLYDDDCIEKAYCEKQTMCKCKKKYHPRDDGLVCVKNSSTGWSYPSFLKFLAILATVMKIS